MASRYTSSSSTSSSLHQRDPARSALFDAYTGDRNRASSSSPSVRSGSGYGNTGASYNPSHAYAHNASSNSGPYTSSPYGSSAASSQQQQQQHNDPASANIGGFRSATPNRKGQYSDAVLSELENQNDVQLEGMSAKVKMLKDLTVAIGDEIKSSTSLAETMNDSFENTRVRLKGTMRRMLRMAEKTGIGWKVWIGFFAFVWALFVWVWLF